MSNIAIFETTTELGGCGLNINGNILEAFCSPSMQKHSQTLLPLFDNLLQSQNLSPKDLQAVAFEAGPGAFSGLRFSVATAQAFALALNIPATFTLLAIPQYVNLQALSGIPVTVTAGE